jgi:hypothetical protein
MDRAYDSTTVMWLGATNPIVDDTTVTFVAGCASVASVGFPADGKSRAAVHDDDGKDLVTDRSCPRFD